MKVIVNSGQLKNAFKVIATIIKSTELTKSITFTTEDNKLVITFKASVIYQTELDIISSQDYINTTITVRHSNLEKILSGMKTSEVEIQTFGVKIINPSVSATLLLSDSVSAKFDIPDLELEEFPFTLFNDSMRKLSKTSVLDKAFCTQAPVMFYEKYSCKRYPYVLVKVDKTVLRGVYQPEFIRFIQSLSPTHYCAYNGNYYFRNNNATLIIPINITSEDNFFINKTKDMPCVAEFNITNVNNILDMLKMVPGSNVKCNIYSQRIGLSVRTSFLEIDSGMVNPLVTFELMSELLVGIFSLIEEDYLRVYRKDELLCLQTMQVAILIRLPD